MVRTGLDYDFNSFEHGHSYCCMVIVEVVIVTNTRNEVFRLSQRHIIKLYTSCFHNI